MLARYHFEVILPYLDRRLLEDLGHPRVGAGWHHDELFLSPHTQGVQVFLPGEVGSQFLELGQRHQVVGLVPIPGVLHWPVGLGHPRL